MTASNGTPARAAAQVQPARDSLEGHEARETLLSWGRRFRHERLVRQALSKVTTTHDLGVLDDDELLALGSELVARLRVAS